ncbi:Gfo/Idh/MocA family protein [Streptomyces maremycinicus]|uniref:Gfo/Idh/MocA family protein n=1 Tax=Streptomyces maremycinicus TaxID=1679753 RepID=UPI00099C49CC|nr:Gfo/Idh/MocA family oxidoreductase [Streptomyces sp. NBRC 110468]
MPPLRLAVVGCGAAARSCHLTALPKVPDIRLTALIDPDPEQAGAALDWYREQGGTSGDVRTARSVDDVSDAFDAAVVAVPHTAHATVTGDLLARGKHVLLEKPMATSAPDTEALAAAAARAPGVRLLMAHPRRLFPANAWVRALIQEGVLGTVTRVRWTEGHPYSWEPVSWSMFDRRLAGGGVLTDTASHVFDILLWWLGTQTEVVDYVDDSLGGVEADAFATLRIGGVRTEVELSRVRALGTSCVITGTEAEVSIGTDFPAGECTLITASGEVRHRGDVQALPPAQDEWDDLFVEQLRNFAAVCADADVEPHATAADGLRVARLIEECYTGPARRMLSQPWLTGTTAGSAA